MAPITVGGYLVFLLYFFSPPLDCKLQQGPRLVHFVTSISGRALHPNGCSLLSNEWMNSLSSAPRLSGFSLPTLAPIPNLKVFEREGLQLSLSFVRPPETPALLLITVTATNTSGGDVTHFICQAAVPKVCKGFGGGLGTPEEATE